jgi:hypothetical protein
MAGALKIIKIMIDKQFGSMYSARVLFKGVWEQKTPEKKWFRSLKIGQ